ncbi:heterokaryon incompatibility protein-domain-containing protein [Lasiosphaeria hispida]|uniref:Heterokaryon incompatibility protein-domain-containing protein n=1 Tax=Lasiosphaeria hispida TaxID=260671 RepID=A0AAJ0HJW3_9PEZI|nr:heterokaryon incompatibility protein-domain-containing protein [Lasiosphaeria hispida]
MWIDQISVNREDPDERSHQVKLMSRIYGHAIKTVVWLGPPDGPCEAGFSLAQKIFRLCENDEFGFESERRKFRLPNWNDRIPTQLLPRHNSRPWTELMQLLGRDWFTRIWVVQEVTLSRNTPILITDPRYGAGSISSLQGSWLSSGITYSDTSLYYLQPKRSLLNLVQIASSRKKSRLDALLVQTSSHDAADPRDCLFALLGMVA